MFEPRRGIYEATRLKQVFKADSLVASYALVGNSAYLIANATVPNDTSKFH